MQITLTSKRQATFPVEVCEAMRIEPGARLEIIPGDQPDEWLIRPFRVREDRLAPLKAFLNPASGPFEINKFREAPKDYGKLRD